MKSPATTNPWDTVRRVLGDNGLLSIILPAYQLGAIIEENIATLCTLLDHHIPFEVIPVDDGSHDDTAAKITAAATRFPQYVHPVLLKQNAGKGNAIRQGFKASRGSHILMLDADLDIRPESLTTFFNVMDAQQADIVVGSKRHPDSVIDYPWHRRLASVVYYTLIRILIGLPISDTQVGMKLFTHDALKFALDRMLVKAFAFDLELLAIAHTQGFRVAEAPITIVFGEKLGCLSPRTVRNVMCDTLAIFYRLIILRYYATLEFPPPMTKPMTVSVIIACPAPSAYLDQCLAALATQTYTHFDVIVLPDAPFTPTHPTPFPLRILATGKIRPAEKRNLGITAATGEVIAFLDDDAYPCAQWLEYAIKYFTDPRVGGVGGPGVTPPDDPLMAQVGGRVLQNILVSGNYRYRYIGGRKRIDVDDYPSCNLLVRHATLDAIHGYRTDFWPGEDTILCADIVLQQKLRIVYDPWALVYHHRRALFTAHCRQIGRYALHRGHFAKRFPATSLRLSYMLPTFLLIGIVFGAAICWLHPILYWLYFSVLALYLGLVFLTSISLMHPIIWMLTTLGVIATHLTYGFRFAQGILSRKMPCEVTRFDHPAEK